MSDELWEDLVGLAARADPVPPLVLQAANESLRWRDPDTALAELVADSAVSGTPVGVRGGRQPRLLTFSTDTLTIEVEASDVDTTIRLVGQLVPPTAARVRVDHRDGVVEVDADDLGRFIASGVTPGPVRLSCTEGSVTTRTAWTLL
jgi:hypothetical protein